MKIIASKISYVGISGLPVLLEKKLNNDIILVFSFQFIQGGEECISVL